MHKFCGQFDFLFHKSPNFTSSFIFNDNILTTKALGVEIISLIMTVTLVCIKTMRKRTTRKLHSS